MKNKRPARGAVAVAIVLASAMALSACGTTSSPKKADAAAPITLNVSWWGSQSRNDATVAAFKLYESLHPNVTIKSEYLPFEGYFQKLATTTAGGAAPDLLAMQYSFFPQYVSRGALSELKGIDVGALDKAALPQGVVNGKRYAVTAGANTQAAAYDPAVFSKAGVAVPSSKWTWDDYESTCKAIVASGAVKYCSNDISVLDSGFDFWMTQHGKSFYTAKGALGFTESDLADFWTRWAALRKENVIPPADVTAEISGDPATYPVVRGLAAMDLTYSGTTPSLSAAAGHQLKTLPFPSGGAGSKPAQYLIGTGIMWSSAATTTHGKAVSDLINFLLTNSSAVALLGVQRGVPFSQEARNHLVDLSPSDKDVVDYVSKVAEGSLATSSPFYNSPPPAASQISKLFSDTGQLVAYGRMSPSAAAAQFMASAKTLLG